jgi:hypothetical protein
MIEKLLLVKQCELLRAEEILSAIFGSMKDQGIILLIREDG